MNVSANSSSQDCFAHYQWTDGGVVFDRRSGYTHFLDQKTMSIFLTIEPIILSYDVMNHSEFVELLLIKMPESNKIEIECGINQLIQISILPN